jgi:hypothetical protein
LHFIISGAQINDEATKRELLSFVYSLEKLGDYLWGNRFTVETKKILEYNSRTVRNKKLNNLRGMLSCSALYTPRPF